MYILRSKTSSTEAYGIAERIYTKSVKYELTFVLWLLLFRLAFDQTHNPLTIEVRARYNQMLKIADFFLFLPIIGARQCHVPWSFERVTFYSFFINYFDEHRISWNVGNKMPLIPFQ